MTKHKYHKSKEILSYSFCSKKLNKGKYDLLLEKAKEIRKFKNLLSLELCRHIFDYLDCSSFTLIKIFGRQDNQIYRSSVIRGNEYQKAVADVLDCYQRKFDHVRNKIAFKLQKSIVKEYYKRKTKNHKIGELKSFNLDKRSTDLSMVLTYLAKNNYPGILDKIKDKILSEKNQDKVRFFQTVLDKIQKYGEERLLELARLRKDNLYKKYCHPIEFRSLAYRSAIQSSNPLIQNNKGFSNAYIILPNVNGKGSRKLVIPTDFSLSYHGHLNSFKSKEYLIQFKAKEIVITTTKTKVKKYLINGSNFLGVDTNLKHNLFSCSNKQIIDIDRELLNQYVRFLKKIDKKERKQKEEKQYKLWQIRFQNELKRKCSQLVDLAIKEGKDHLVLEDLGKFGKSWIRSLELEGFKYSRLVRLLNLSSLKKIVSSICQKKGIQLTLIPSYYTSQMCSNCGSITRENRLNQENFICTNCGEHRNADFNSSVNICLIGCLEVLSSLKLTKRNSSKWLVPKALTKYQVKDHLEDIIILSVFQQQRKKLIS